MSMFTMHCYEESEDVDDGLGNGSASGGSSKKKASSFGGSRAPSGSLAAPSVGRTHLSLQSDMGTLPGHTMLVGKGTVVSNEASLQIAHLEDGERMLRRFDKVEIEGRLYKVKAVDMDTRHVTLETKIESASRPRSKSMMRPGGPDVDEASGSGNGTGASTSSKDPHPLPATSNAGAAPASTSLAKDALLPGMLSKLRNFGGSSSDASSAMTNSEGVCLSTGGSLSSPTRTAQPRTVWVYRWVQASVSHNADVQSLLYDMGVHELAIQLLQLPIQMDKMAKEDLPTRAVLCASYRLLRAMATHFPVVQKALVSHVHTFIKHTEANLVASDISPTECLSAVYKNNRVVCTQVGENMVRHFVGLAAVEHAPRYLRFLGMITYPSGRPVRRCQTLVLSCLTEKEEALQLFNNEDELAYREQLVEENDHVNHPRGELAYHIELIGLLARCIEGAPPNPVVQLRSMMPFSQLLTHLLQDQLPLQLRASYLAIFDGLYLDGSNKTSTQEQDEEVREGLVMVMDAQLSAIDRFIEDVAPVASFEDSDEIDEATFIFTSVLNTVRLFYLHIFTRSDFGTSMDVFTQSLAHAVLLLGHCADANPSVMPAAAVSGCLDAIFVAGSHLVTKHIVIDDGVTMDNGGAMDVAPLAEESSQKRYNRSRMTRITRMTSVRPTGAVTVTGTGSGTGCSTDANTNVHGIGITGSLRSGDHHPQESLQSFIEGREQEMAAHIAEEEKGLVSVFMDRSSTSRSEVEGHGQIDLDARYEDGHLMHNPVSDANGLFASGRGDRSNTHEYAHRGSGESHLGVRWRRSSLIKLSESHTVTYTRNLIAQLEGSSRNSARRLAGEETQGSHAQRMESDVTQAIASLRVLITMLKQHTNAQALSRQQKLLTLLGAPTVVLVMASCEHDELCLKGLQLGIALLDGGNADVQEACYRKLTDPASEEAIRPFDGSTGTFLSMMRWRLRLAMREVHERRTFEEVREEMRVVISEEYSGPTLVALQKEIDLDFPARSHAREVLELLRLLCEGHYGQMQDYLHEQPSSLSNADLVGDTYELLAELEPEIDDTTIKQIQSCVDALVEFLQGNTSKKAANFFLDTKLLETLDRLLQKAVAVSGVEEFELLDMQHSVVLLLLALLEGAAHRAKERMLSVVDIHRLAEIAGSLSERSRDLPFVPSEEDSEYAKDLAQRMAALGYQLYILIQQLCDYQEHESSHGGAERSALAAETPAYASYAAQVARVELINASGELECVYFRFPAFCLLLTEESKQKVLWSVDRSTPGRQVQDFFDVSVDLHHEMRHQERLNHSKLWRVLTRNKGIALNSTFGLAIVQNLILVLHYSPSGVDELDATLTAWAEAIHRTLGACQVLACVVVFLMHVLEEGPLRLRQQLRDAFGLPTLELQLKMTNDRLFALRYWLLAPYYLLTDPKLLFYICAFVAAVLGLMHSPLFYCFHLLDMANKSVDLQSVFQAVTLNGRSILMTALFGFVVIYIYAIAGFAFLQDLFVAGDYPDPDIDWCTNLFVCWVSAVVNGLREGDIGRIMEPRPSTDDRFVWITLYQFTYYLIVITVLLNVIFGIIIDTFGELRTTQERVTRSMRNACFICGVDRFTFDTQGAGFKRHICEDHNMWHYLFMLVHIREKAPTEYNGWEQYVADKMNANDTSFFPLNMAMVLKGHRERQERESQQVIDRVRDVSSSLDNLGRHVEKMEKAFIERLEALATSQRSLEDALYASDATNRRSTPPSSGPADRHDA